MNARTESPAGWVTVAEAAAALTKEGDPIDPSNVSRYLARWPDVPSAKRGKYRFVDLAALRRHRQGNVLSIEKRESRDEALARQSQPLASSPVHQADDVEDDDDLPLGIGPEIQQANLRLKLLQVREKERADAIAEGELVPLPEVVALVSGAFDLFVAELERSEQAVAGKHGREVAATFRRSRKEAQAKASARLRQLARERQIKPAATAGIEAVLDGGETLASVA